MMESSGNGKQGKLSANPPPVTYDLSESENEEENEAQAQLRIPCFQNTPATPPLLQFERGRYLFPAPLDTFDLPPRPHLPQGELEETFSAMSADLDGFTTPDTWRRQSRGGSSMSPVGRTPGRSSDRTPPTSISMLVHNSMEKPKGQGVGSQMRRMRTPFTTTQQMQEDLYDSIGEKPSNLLEENQVLYRTLDDERKRLILRKGLCSFMYGALKARGSEVDLLRCRVTVKTEECAARVIFQTLLLQTYRKVQEELLRLTTDNNQLNKKVENLCLQLRVVRHLQTAEKERVVEKIHEIGTLKTEVAYVKKILNKSKSDLEKVEQECEALERVNAGLAEEKYKMGREVRCLQEKKEILQGSLDMEKKRTEKQTTSIKELKRQVVDLRQQLSDLRKQSDEWEERARGFEGKNWELQGLIESRGKQVIELSKNRDILASQAALMENTTLELQFKNEELEIDIKKQREVTKRVKESLVGAESQLNKQSARIGIVEDEIGRMTRESFAMRSELGIYQGRNIRRRRSWVRWTMGMGDPLVTILGILLGIPNEFIL